MIVGRRTAAVLTVDLYGGSAAAVALRPASGRWPAQEARDRLDVAVGFVATTLLGAEGFMSRRVQHQAMTVAAGLVDAPAPLAADDWAEHVAGRSLVGPGLAGDPRIEARLIRTRRGARIDLVGARPTTLALSTGSAAVAAVVLRDAPRDLRLGAALAMEGLLLWSGESANRRHGQERALCEAYVYAVRRLANTLVPPPEALRSAVSADGGRVH
ncbi:MAG TPA: hypothetical protein PKD59_07705 [Miltoncostaeaceae bacterium]|nr:hypothetical protein [Miltoncostaeaceae bacterium]